MRELHFNNILEIISLPKIFNFWNDYQWTPQEKEAFIEGIIFTAFDYSNDLCTSKNAITYAMQFINTKNSAYFDGVDASSTDEQILDELNKTRTVANDIKNNADKYAQFILKNNPYIYTADPDLIAFLSTKEDNISQHVVTLEGLTNYLKWCGDNIESPLM